VGVRRGLTGWQVLIVALCEQPGCDASYATYNPDQDHVEELLRCKGWEVQDIPGPRGRGLGGITPYAFCPQHAREATVTGEGGEPRP
jgi:hypothetical protein